MIKQTRFKITLATTLILLVVFIAIGITAFLVMNNKPKRYPFDNPHPGGINRPADPDFDKVLKEVENQLAKEWIIWYSVIASASLALLAIVAYILSGWIVKPIKEAIEKQKRFISDASHELKTPVAIISANASLLNNDIDDSKWLSNIIFQAQRIENLSHELLELAELDEKKQLEVSHFNLSNFIETKAMYFESAIFEASKSFEVLVDENIYTNANKDSIEKALSILLDNALKHSGLHATITVKLSKMNDKVVLVVRNTNSGVTEEEKEKIFDRFYRSDQSRSRNTGGSGLGLAILHSIVKKQNWKINLNSDGHNFTEFVITF